MFLVLNSMIPFPAPCAAYGSGCPGKRIWNAKCYACKDIPGYCVSLGMSVSYGRSPSGSQPCGYRRRTIPAGHSPAPVPIQSLRTCSLILFPANGCTGRMTNPHLLNLLSLLFVPFPPQRCDTISPWPHLLSVTSCQVDLCSPDNSGQLVRNFCCRSLLGNVRQLVPHFQRRASIKRAPTWRTFLPSTRPDNSCQLGTNF